MPIIAAPLEAVAVLGADYLILSREVVTQLVSFTGFVLAGVPVYYLTHREQAKLPFLLSESSR